MFIFVYCYVTTHLYNVTALIIFWDMIYVIVWDIGTPLGGN